jgi:hypothetical protein
MALLIFSDMQTFAEVLNLKQLSWHAAWFLPYSDSWQVAVNSDIKHSMHYMGGHDVAVHDVDVHSPEVYCVSMHGMDLPGSKKTSI